LKFNQSGITELLEVTAIIYMYLAA